MDSIITFETAHFFYGLMFAILVSCGFGLLVGYAAAVVKWKNKHDKVLRDYILTCEAYHEMWLQYLTLRSGARGVLKWLESVQPQQIPPQSTIDIFVEELQEPRNVRREGGPIPDMGK